MKKKILKLIGLVIVLILAFVLIRMVLNYRFYQKIFVRMIYQCRDNFFMSRDLLQLINRHALQISFVISFLLHVLNLLNGSGYYFVRRDLLQ